VKIIKFDEQNGNHVGKGYFPLTKHKKKGCVVLEHSGTPKLENFLGLKNYCLNT
jgi:hypothetical protein